MPAPLRNFVQHPMSVTAIVGALGTAASFVVGHGDWISALTTGVCTIVGLLVKNPWAR